MEKPRGNRQNEAGRQNSGQLHKPDRKAAETHWLTKEEAKAKSFGGRIAESAEAKRTCEAIEPDSGTNL